MRFTALVLALAVLPTLAACGASNSASASPEPADVQAALEARLLGKKLSYRWIVCVRTARSFVGNRIFRCNVNFGEPHIVRYCATLEAGRFVTDREQPQMRCGRGASS